MFHSGTQTLIHTWASLPNAKRIPKQAAFDPSLMPQQAGSLFVMERREDGLFFRLAGSWIERLHGQSLAGLPWLSFWASGGRALLNDTVNRAFRDGRPMIVTAEGGEMRAPLEITFAPMRNADGVANRLLGLYQPTTLIGADLQDLPDLTVRLAISSDIPATRAPLMLAAVDGQRIAG